MNYPDLILARQIGTAMAHIERLLKIIRDTPEPASNWDRQAREVAIERAETFLRGDAS